MKKKNLVIGVIVSILLAINSTLVLGQNAKQKDFGKKLDGHLNKLMQKFEIPGLSVVVTKKGKVVYKRAFGVRNLEGKGVLKTNHIFHMASVSKPFVATAIMQLVEKGKIKLDEKVTTYLPYFKLNDERYKDITVKQMLNHTSGMPDVNDYEWDKPQYDVGAAERYVRSLTNKKMLWAPGSKFRYSNMAFDTLGDVIAKVSGMPFEDYVKKNILNPLGMKNSSFLRKEIPNKLRTSGHVWKLKAAVSDVYPYNRRHAPSSTLNSSVEEMANWAFVNLNRGELNGKRILKKESYDLLFGKTADVNSRRSVALSWFLDSHRGLKVIGHSGSDTGFSSYFAIIPEKDIGIVIASNYSRTPMGSVYRIVADTVLGFEPKMPKISIAMPFAKILVNDGIKAAKTNYRELREKNVDQYSFGAGQLNGLGYVLMREKRMAEALEVFKFNVELYPKVANVYDSLGEAYVGEGKKKLAIANYKRALELDPTMASAKEMLAKLEKGNTSSPITVKPEMLESYAGKYQIKGGPLVTITVENGQLFGEPAGQSKIALFPKTSSVFVAKGVDVKLTFERDDDGKVSGFTAILNGVEMKGEKVE